MSEQTVKILTASAKARRTAASAWLERTNPLAGLSIRAAQRIYDAARGGDFSRIQYLYSEIERENPVLMTCVDRRASALSGLGWRVSTQRDGAEADEQKQALEERLSEAEGMDEALEHLALAFFRGFAHARPVWDGPGKLAGFDLLNGWNFARDPATGTWFWNPRAEYCDPSKPGPGLEEVPRGELVTVSRVREIDRPALALCLRDAVGSRDWGRFLERYGLPFVVLTAPSNASDATMPRYAEAAEKIADGLSTAVPFGSSVSFAESARGTDPFTPFETFVHKLIVLMSTGGTLTSLAESGAGTLAGNAQMQVWEQIVKRDGVAIGAAMDRAVCRPLLRDIRDFAGRPPLVKFELGGDRQLEPGEIFEVAAKARAAGYRISKDELEKATGYTLEEDPGSGQPGFPGGGGLALNARMPLQRPISALQRGVRPSEGENARPEPAPALKRVLAAFRSDLGPTAEELQKVLALPEGEMREACKDLSGRLPDLLPANPAMAAVLAEELAGAFTEALGGTGTVENARGGNPDNRGQFSTHEGPHGREPETPKTSDAFGTTDTDKLTADDYKLGRERLRSVVSHILAKKEGEGEKAFWRADLGWVGIDYGEPGNPNNDFKGGHGLAHIAAKHGDAAKNLEEMFTRGEAFKHDKSERKVYLIKGRDVLVLSKKRNGRLLVTDFGPASDRDLAVYKSKGKYHVRGENE